MALFIPESLETMGFATGFRLCLEALPNEGHRNAKTDVYQRRTQRRAAEAAGVSVRTVAKWLTRDRTALTDQSSRPHRPPRLSGVPMQLLNVTKLQAGYTMATDKTGR